MGEKDRIIYQISIIRSGSTLVYQILYSLFPNKKIIKQHYFPEGIRDPIVSTYRDLRDILVSTWRTFILSKNRQKIRSEMTEEDVNITFNFLKKSINNFNDGKRRYGEDVLWLKYEDFYKDMNVIFDAFEEYFDIEISNEKRNIIKNDCNIEKNKERSKAFKHFGDYDYLGTEIHGDHIFNADVGGWKKIIPDNLHEMVNDRLRSNLELWGYKV